MMNNKERFSLLILEPNEIYFEDFSVNFLGNTMKLKRTNDDISSSQTDGAEIPGRLKMCSKSMVFDSKDTQIPIIKMAYKDCDKIYSWTDEQLLLEKTEANVLAIRCNQYIEMLDKNILAPYRFVNEDRLFLFKLHYTKVDDIISQFEQLHRAASLHALEQNDMIATIVYSRNKRLKFDPIWLDDIYEKIVIDNTVDEIRPLIMNPGRILLTTNGIYFQPYNNIQPYPVLKIKLSFIKSITKRRFLLRHTSLELKWSDNISETEHILFISFRTQNERDLFYSTLFEQEHLNIIKHAPESMMLKWQNGIISNYEYLLYLNSLADRTFQDLTQYPVFPWIISDYVSKEIDLNDKKYYRDLKKPIGALNADRLIKLKERSEEMPEPKFLYGSHYSAPGLVLYYLVRKHPKLMLCLQNGKFDHPDRMFNKLEDTYRNCLNNMSDFKELIPEFYDINQDGDFLLNNYKINFGIRHDGVPVNNVQLPPWAEGSPTNFIKILRDALESDYVSKNLNYWIDLIFGYKQRGDEAKNSDNLFYYLCYEGSVDLDKITDLSARHALEVQISEFGQIPKQLFDKPHVSKLMFQSVPLPLTGDRETHTELTSILKNEQLPSDTDGIKCDINDLILYNDLQSHKDEITCLIRNSMNGNNFISTGKDGILKCYNILENRQVRSVSIGNLPLSCCKQIVGTNTIILGSWDNTIITYDLDYGRISNVIPAHDDAVSCLSLIDSSGVLISGSWDCSIKIWKGFDKTISSFRMSDSMWAYLPFDEKVSCLDAFQHKNIVPNDIKIIIGLYSGEIYLYTFSSLGNHQLKLIKKHRKIVSAVAFNSTGTTMCSCSHDGYLSVFNVETGMTIYERSHTNSLSCLNWTLSNDILLLGDINGKLFTYNMITGEHKLEKDIYNGAITSILTSMDHKFIILSGNHFNEYFITIWTIT